jgi:hypothetical protein
MVQHKGSVVRLEDVHLSSDADDPLDYRRWADICAKEAANPDASRHEREYLLSKQRALLALAASEDWLGDAAPPRKDH